MLLGWRKIPRPSAVGRGEVSSNCGASCLELAERTIDIFHFQADVVHALAALLQEPRDTGVGVDRLEKLDLASAGSSQR